jgi:hypothetical protein
MRHTSASVSIRLEVVNVLFCIPMLTYEAYVSMCQHTSAYVSIRLVVVNVLFHIPMLTYEAYVSIRQHTSSSRQRATLRTDADV